MRRPRAEPYSSARQIPKRSPKLLSWNYTSCRGTLPTRESFCIMSRGVPQLAARQLPLCSQGHGHPNPPGQLSQPCSLTPRSLWPAAKMQLYLNYQSRVKIGLNPSNLGVTPILPSHLYPHVLLAKGRMILSPTVGCRHPLSRPQKAECPFYLQVGYSGSALS